MEHVLDTGLWTPLPICGSHRGRMMRLILNRGRADERVVPLGPGAFTIGRAPDNEVAILHHSLSRRHARVEVAGEHVTIQDLESKNGTFVDNNRITRTPLVGGETIRCGDVVMVVATDQDPAPKPLPPAAPTFVCNINEDVTRFGIDRLLGGTSHAIGGALNIRKGPETDRAQDKLRILLKVGQALSTPESIDKQLNKILDLLMQILDVDRAAVLLVDPATGQMEPRVVQARTPNFVDDSFSKSIVQYVREQSVAALFSDAASDPRLADARSVMGLSIRASMCAPLKPREDVFGVLYVDNRTTPNRFTSEDLEFLSAFANQAAIAIENSMLYARIERDAVRRNNLLRFFPPSTAARLAQQENISLEPIETEVTALFSDISGFTAMSSTMTPMQIVALLNEYFPPVAEIVFRHEGTLEKYIGDALLAVWGAPFRHDMDAERAVQAAIDMQKSMIRFNESRLPAAPLHIHIGVNTGPVAAGNIGSAHYIQYATIGDTTNVASRICSVAQSGEIMIADSTLQRLAPGSIPTEPVAPVLVKGKDVPLQLHRVIWER
jgi:adenylate cyclase